MLKPTAEDFERARTYLLCELPKPWPVADFESWLSEFDHEYYAKMWSSGSEPDKRFVRDMYEGEMRTNVAYNILLDKCIEIIDLYMTAHVRPSK